MKRRAWPLAMALLLAIPLGLLLQQVARDFLLRELLDLAWGLKLRFESLPQTTLWAGFLAIACLVALGSLVRRGRPRRPAPGPTAEPPGPVRLLSERIRDARDIEYARRRLARDVRALTLEVLAHEYRSTAQQMRQCLDQGTLDLPPDVQAYLRADDAAGAAQGKGLLWHLRRRLPGASQQAPIDSGLETAVHFLEARLRHEPAQEGLVAAQWPLPSAEGEHDT